MVSGRRITKCVLNRKNKKSNTLQSKLIEESKKLVIDTEQRLTKAIDELEKIKC